MELQAEIRKVQITGGSTYVVSLPKKWIETVNLKPKDQIALVPQPDMSLLLIPRNELRLKEVKESLFDASQIGRPEAIVTEFIAHYLVGYDIIRVKLRDAKIRSFLRNAIHQKLIGTEIIEETENEITAQCLLGSVDLPLDRALRRMHILTVFMLRDTIKALSTNDKELAKEIIFRDDEVDRLYLFIVRQLKATVENRLLVEEIGLTHPRDCLGYRLIVKSIERSADHAARIAKISSTLETPLEEKTIESLASMSRIAAEIQEASVKTLYKYDAQLAHETIVKIKDVANLEEEIIGKLLKLKTNTKTIIDIRLILESIRRIAEYGTDISEIAINLHVKTPS
ncbi:phosphate uptake regulator PhoU [Candidatus Bathyarchaeota archaeon]|nr:phosphate uptake regulator PhoU [Candidatus Bathyarchaeota archaeon]